MTTTLTRTATWLNKTAQQKAALPRLPFALFMTDGTRTPDLQAALQSLPPKVGVIFRHYDAPDRAALAGECFTACREQRRFFSISGDWRLAVRLGADGIHLPEHHMHVAARLRQSFPNKIMTTSVHSRRALAKASQSGAHAALASPVFATTSHPGTRPLGVVTFATWCQASDIPLYALGGVNRNSVQRLWGTGAVGIAGIDGLIAADT